MDPRLTAPPPPPPCPLPPPRSLAAYILWILISQACILAYMLTTHFWEKWGDSRLHMLQPQHTLQPQQALAAGPGGEQQARAAGPGDEQQAWAVGEGGVEEGFQASSLHGPSSSPLQPERLRADGARYSPHINPPRIGGARGGCEESLGGGAGQGPSGGGVCEEGRGGGLEGAGHGPSGGGSGGRLPVQRDQAERWRLDTVMQVGSGLSISQQQQQDQEQQQQQGQEGEQVDTVTGLAGGDGSGSGSSSSISRQQQEQQQQQQQQQQQEHVEVYIMAASSLLDLPPHLPEKEQGAGAAASMVTIQEHPADRQQQQQQQQQQQPPTRHETLTGSMGPWGKAGLLNLVLLGNNTVFFGLPIVRATFGAVGSNTSILTGGWMDGVC